MPPKYKLRIVSVMSEFEQRRLILQAKQDCYKLSEQRKQQQTNSSDNVHYGTCRVTWDSMMCWDLTPANTRAKQLCPDYVNGFNINEHVTKECTGNGTWYVNGNGTEWSNFTDCLKPSIDLSYHAHHGDHLRLLYTAGYSISLASLLVAVSIMVGCKRLHSKSNTLHINLFLAFILRAAVAFLKDILFVANVGLAKDVRKGEDGVYEFIHDARHWECKLLMTILVYSVNACNMQIMSEALYLSWLLHRPLAVEGRAVRAFVTLGWSFAFVLIIPWIIIKAVIENTYCWNVQQNPLAYWILRGQGLVVIVVNFFLFLNIFRMLFLKIRQSSQLRTSGKLKIRKLAKFIMVLIPLCGVMYILFYVAMPSSFDASEFHVAYLYIEMSYNSFQGFFIALLFCFLNEDVQKEIRRACNGLKNRRLKAPQRRPWPEHSKQQMRQPTHSHSNKTLQQQRRKQQQQPQWQQHQNHHSVQQRMKHPKSSASESPPLIQECTGIELPYIDSETITERGSLIKSEPTTQ